LKVALDATVRFIAEQSVQTILRFPHKTPNQQRRRSTETSQLLPGKQTIDRIHKINNNVLLLTVKLSTPAPETEREAARLPARAYIG